MKTSEIFQRLEEANLQDAEVEIIKLLEESFADITQENQSDYLSVEDYFSTIKGIFPNREIISTIDLKTYIQSRISSYKGEDLLFLDGLNTLAKCLTKYDGKDDLQLFENWFYDRIKKIKI